MFSLVNQVDHDSSLAENKVMTIEAPGHIVFIILIK